MEKLSVVIMTYNEEENIGRCIDSVLPVADELLLIDSFSTDQTLEIAKSKGARILQHPFHGYIEQRAVCIREATYNFVLALDADEVLSEKLRDEILRVKESKKADAYTFNRLSQIGDQWIYHGGWHPDWKLRLFDRRKVKAGGEKPHDRIVPQPDAKVLNLKGKLLHYSDKDFSERIHTINKLSTSAAESLFLKGKKTSWARILLKPSIRFFSDYFLKRGFLDGYYGFLIAKSTGLYVFLREAKLMELYKRKK